MSKTAAAELEVLANTIQKSNIAPTIENGINYNKFETYWKEELCTIVELDEVGNCVHIERPVTTIPKQQLNGKQTRESIYDFIVSRCFEEARPDKYELLNRLGLTEYNPWEIVKVTHGRLWDDYLWIKFEGEDLTWKDVAYDRDNYTR